MADAVAVAEVDEDQVGVELVDHRQRGVHRELVGRVAADRDDRLRLPAVRGAGAEDAVEVLLRQHGAGREPVPVEPLDDGREVQVGRPVEGADGLLVAVVDGVGRHAAAVGPHAGHHHHVVGDGLHDGHRPGAREVRAVVTQQRQVRRPVRGDLAGPAAVDDEHVDALAARAPRLRGRAERAGEHQRRPRRRPDLEELSAGGSGGRACREHHCTGPSTACTCWVFASVAHEAVQLTPVSLSARSPMMK